MANKTKAELMEEVKTKNDEINALKDEIEKLDRYKVYQDSADELGAIHKSYIEAGFSEDQAFELTKMMIQVAATSPFLRQRR